MTWSGLQTAAVHVWGMNHLVAVEARHSKAVTAAAACRDPRYHHYLASKAVERKSFFLSVKEANHHDGPEQSTCRPDRMLARSGGIFLFRFDAPRVPHRGHPTLCICDVCSKTLLLSLLSVCSCKRSMKMYSRQSEPSKPV